MSGYVVHAASVAEDARVIETLGAALDGTGKPLVVTAGTPAVPGQVATEHDRPPAGSPRVP